MLIRLLTYVVDTVVTESQCGFRRARSTTDMIFVARLIQENCRKQHRDLFIAFIDLIKAFDTFNRDLLWQVLGKFGCPPSFLSILLEFHIDMSARVVQGGEMSKSFGVNTGVTGLYPSTCYFQPLPCSSDSHLSSQHLCCRWRSHQVQARWQFV